MAKTIPELFFESDNLYVFTVDEGVIIFKPLTYREYKIAKKCEQFYTESLTDLEDWVWEKCVIEHTVGHSYDVINAGTVVSLYNCVMELSCPASLEQANYRLQLGRAELTDVLNSATVIICQAFPNYTTRQVEDMYWADIVKKLAESEIILGRELDFRKDAPQQDDSHKVFAGLDRMSKDNLDVILRERAVDFTKENNKLNQV